MHPDQLKNSFSEAYEQFSDAIFRHCYFRVRERQAALDLMQETFMKVWRQLAQEQAQIKNIRAFLYTVANNLIIDRSRKKKEASLEAMEAEGFNPGERDTAFNHDSLVADEVRALLKEINPKYREAVTLRYFDDMGPKEIAQILGISQNNASVRIHNGLKELRKKYPEEML